MKNTLPLSYTILPKEHGMRLDASLGRMFPDMGVRARRRLWEWCSISVNGRPQPPGFFVTQKDKVEVIEKTKKILQTCEVPSPLNAFDAEEKDKSLFISNPMERGQKSKTKSIFPSVLNEHDFGGVASLSHEQLVSQATAIIEGESTFENGICSRSSGQILFAHGDFILVYKPAKIHTAIVKGKNSFSIEGLLADIWKSQRCMASDSNACIPMLLTRLDFLTSGILLSAKNAEAKKRFRQWEKEGSVEKSYLAWVHGKVGAPFVATHALNVSNRSKTSVCHEEADKTRRSYIYPLVYAKGEKREVYAGHDENDTLLKKICVSVAKSASTNDSNEKTLVKVVIHRGARHQIRAHMSHAGFPLLGDPLYGIADTSSFFLHHYAVTTPEFSYTLLQNP